MQQDNTRARSIKVLFVVVPVVALGLLLFSRSSSSDKSGHLLEDLGPPPSMTEGNVFSSSPRPGQAGQEVPWHVLPEGSYTPPYGGRGAQAWRYAADAAINMPLSASTLFFTAQGAGLGGVLNINNDGRSGAADARVDVRMYYTAAHLAGRAQLLREQPAAGRHGLAVKTPMRCGQDERMFFDIRVHLPRGSAQQPQRVANLESDLGNFAHVLGDLADGVQFGRIALTGANEPIQAKSLSADVAQIRTSNAAVEGHYITNNKLSLNTDNGGIDAAITLTNAGGRATTLDLGASNGEVSAALTLLSTQQGGSGGSFAVDAQTSNGGVHLRVPEAPLDAALRLHAASAIGDVTAALPPAFEGAFALAQSFPAPEVRWDARARDPAGAGRVRAVAYAPDRNGVVVGKATWGEPGPGKVMGDVKLTTSIGNTKLVL
ncbi:hypothetical protein PsYK624_077980 [Phanerochaete sordida]|uniref:DUF7330 domain-containing protein n=1 Tax=Phanerochaete sordida TaxID=48140 RepID=A0A9P3LEL7_9APHY|nr:hypothetical protein PsYK624_077980 [Phanerochaete sordida]